MISPIEAPTSRLSKTTETGVRVSLNTHAPLRLPGMLSTAGHCDQSRLAMICSPAALNLFAHTLFKLGLMDFDVHFEWPPHFRIRQRALGLIALRRALDSPWRHCFGFGRL